MDKWRSYCSGIGICLILIAVIGICALHDQIYMWSLGDISDRYRQGMNAYREHDYDEARNRFILLAGIDSASYAQYLLGDMYYRGLGGRVDYEKAFALFEKSGEAGNMNACNNLKNIFSMQPNKEILRLNWGLVPFIVWVLGCSLITGKPFSGIAVQPLMVILML